MATVKLCGTKYEVEDVSKILTVPDCVVVRPNKIGTGNGEAKFYFGPKKDVDRFFLGEATLNCVLLKSDLKKFLQGIKIEYLKPSRRYAAADSFPSYWKKRKKMVDELPDMIPFSIDFQGQISGPRGYLKSPERGFQIIRELSLPYVSYVSIMRLKREAGGHIYYWRLFVDFNAIQQKGVVPKAMNYGKGSKAACTTEKGESARAACSEKKGRSTSVQDKYRKDLLKECFFCPITMISDERLLVASHIKPARVSSPAEEADPKNGFMLSPLYDKLFDQGFLTFDANKKMKVSNWLSPENQKRCNIRDGIYVQYLPLDAKREVYMKYHRKHVFKG